MDRLNEIGCKVLTPEDSAKRHGLFIYNPGDYELDAKSYQLFNLEWSGEKPMSARYRWGRGDQS